MIDHASFSDGRRRFLIRGVAALGMLCGWERPPPSRRPLASP